MNEPGPADLVEVLDPAAHPLYDLALRTDVGTDRQNNEDSCGHRFDGDDTIVFAVADGIGGYEGGEVASAMAIEVTLDSYCSSPEAWGPAKRLHRAVQRANIEIHNRALTIPELRRMGTTLTAAVVAGGALNVAHVGDCRLFLIRDGRISQLTKDHTMVQERVRMGLMTAARAKNHPERSALSRSIGHDLIVSVDRIAVGLRQHDRLVLCTDGLYNVIDERELERTIRSLDCAAACNKLIEIANQRGAADNVTAALLTLKGPGAAGPPPSRWGRLTSLLRRPRSSAN
jgi:PPM family protein phosphatase